MIKLLHPLLPIASGESRCDTPAASEPIWPLQAEDRASCLNHCSRRAMHFNADDSGFCPGLALSGCGERPRIWLLIGLLRSPLLLNAPLFLFLGHQSESATNFSPHVSSGSSM